jgi:hypothetical protein
MKLRIGNRLTIEVKDFAEASRIYSAERDASGEGGSTFPVGRLPGHYVSYNGRVWKGSPKAWQAGNVPVYDNRVAT